VAISLVGFNIINKDLLQLRNEEIVVSLGAYACIAIFLKFSEDRHNKNNLAMRKNNETIHYLNKSLTQELEISKGYQILFEKTKVPTMILENNKFIDCNKAGYELLGYENKNEFLYTHPGYLSPQLQPNGESSLELSQKMINLVIKKGSHNFEWVYLKKDGSPIYVEVHLTQIPMKNRNIIHAVLTDITQRKKLELKIDKQNQKLYKQLRTNSLTTLPNEISLYEYMNEKDDEFSLLYIDVDNFDTYNDIFGRAFSDEILKQVATTLKAHLNNQITLYHLGADEFIYLIKNPYIDQDIKLAKLVKILFEQVTINQQDVDISLTFSIGIARGEKLKLISNAKMALKDVKEDGKNNHKLFVYSSKKDEQHKNNIYWMQKIKEIIATDNLIVYYQPIVDNQTEKTAKYECLVRAVDGEKVISPFFFIDSAKSIGMLQSITKIVIDKSFKAFEHNDFEFSINITNEDLKQNYLISFLSYKIKQYNINPNRVILEILENITANDSDNATDQFNTLKNIGFQIAIDDFGAEASNLSRLLTLHADTIKIDAQFIKNLDTDPNSITIVETVVSLAKKLGAKTVAEFVHNEEIYKIVKSLGVDYSQGYYFSPPLAQIPDPQKEQFTEELSLTNS
jgi:diguanylate cyclase (GGDEF)-like protein/PAS domain S-box-containing protein